MRKILLTLSLLLIGVMGSVAQTGYQNHTQLSERLKKLSTQYTSLASIQSLAKTITGKDVWALVLSKGDASKKPAIAIVAGVDGTHLAGTELAVQIAEKMLTNSNKDTLANLLATRTVYIIPCVNPEAMEQFFGKPKYERTGNASRTDEDRDGKFDEDPAEDLNGDGLISMMRVEDPTGTYMFHKDDARVLVKADPNKGEKGKYLYLTEGTDNDKDGKFNEDGAGGVALNKNFTFDFPFFTPGSGEYPVSENENRGLLDFLYEARNVYAVFTFGPSNNLTEAYKFDRVRATKRIVAGWLEKDCAINEQVAKLYGQAGIKDLPSLPPSKGDYPSSAYFHYGRLSFSTPGWYMPKDTAKRGATDNDDVRFLRWSKANNIENVFVNWTEVKHPDYPNQKVEVGGLAPFVKMNPPATLLSASADKHLKFFTTFLQIMPLVEIVNVKTEVLTTGMTRISCDVHNKGMLPTHSELGTRIKYVDRLKVKLATGNGQQIVSGRGQQLLREPIEGNGTMHFEWLVSGSGTVTIEAGSAMIGSASSSVKL